MTILHRTALAAAFATLAAPAMADQFIVALPAPLDAAHAPVLDTLKISVVDAFEHDGTHFAVLDAPGEAYLETLFNVVPARPISLAKLPVDWSDAAMAGLDTGARMRFGTSLACGFCS